MRRIGVWVVLCAVVWPAMGQLSGRWEVGITLFPGPTLDKGVLTLTYSFGTWYASSISTFTSLGYTAQEFQLGGSLGPLGISGGMSFNPSQTGSVVVEFPPSCDPQTASYSLNPPEYMWAWIKPELSFTGIELSLELEHWRYPYVPPKYWANPNVPEYKWPCCEPSTPATSSYMRYTWTLAYKPVALVARFEDCCYGIMFKDFSFTLKDVALCCSISYDAELYFTKQGFQYFKFTGENLLALCCGFSFDIGIKFTVEGKEVTLNPKWVGLGEACFQLFGDVVFVNDQIVGLEIYGFRIFCLLGNCTSVEFVEAYEVDEVEAILGDIFENDENEVIRLRFCGQGCCGGTYHVKVDIFFAPSAGLFNLSRAKVETAVPVLANLIFTGSFSLPATGSPILTVGGILTF